MNAAYPLLIQEEVAQLQAAEKAARDKARTDRLRRLRFLKEERVAGVSQAAEVLGYSVRTVQRWWQCYRRRLGGAAGATAATWREGAPLAGGLGGPAGGDAGWPHRRGARGTSLSARHLAHCLWHRCDFQGVSPAQDQAEDRTSPSPQDRQSRRSGGV